MSTRQLMFKINNAANNYEKTKENKYKKEWYQLIKEFGKGVNNENNSNNNRSTSYDFMHKI